MGRTVRRQAASAEPSLVTDAATSARLGRIRQADTSPELVVRRALHMLGARFRTGRRDLPGSPDIANLTRRWAIFVHGCFWHRHEGCRKTTTPKRNAAFWLSKFEANVARDRRVIRELRRAGIRVLIVWECETSDGDRLASRLKRFLEDAGAPPPQAATKTGATSRAATSRSRARTR